MVKIFPDKSNEELEKIFKENESKETLPWENTSKEIIENNFGENAYSRLRRILSCDIPELSGKDLEFRQSYERGKKEAKKKIEPLFRGDLRSHLYDFGYEIPMNEMKRDFYLKNRLNKVERKNMLDVFEMIEKASIKKEIGFWLCCFGCWKFSLF